MRNIPWNTSSCLWMLRKRYQWVARQLDARVFRAAYMLPTGTSSTAIQIQSSAWCRHLRKRAQQSYMAPSRPLWQRSACRGLRPTSSGASSARSSLLLYLACSKASWSCPSASTSSSQECTSNAKQCCACWAVLLDRVLLVCQGSEVSTARNVDACDHADGVLSVRVRDVFFLRVMCCQARASGSSEPCRRGQVAPKSWLAEW